MDSKGFMRNLLRYKTTLYYSSLFCNMKSGNTNLA